jgi:hypothetical protein
MPLAQFRACSFLKTSNPGQLRLRIRKWADWLLIPPIASKLTPVVEPVPSCTAKVGWPDLVLFGVYEAPGWHCHISFLGMLVVHGRTYPRQRDELPVQLFWSSSTTFPPISDHQTPQSLLNIQICDGIKTLYAVLDGLGGTVRAEAPRAVLPKQDRGAVNSE